MRDLYQTGSGPIIIIGNGPSLSDISDAFLRKYPSFGSNAINLRRDFEPTFYCVADDWVMDGPWKDIVLEFPKTPKFVLDILGDHDDPNVYPWHRKDGSVWLDLDDVGPDMLLNPGVAFKGITHAMIQIARWMGYEKFFLVGCDNTGGGEHFYPDVLNDFELDEDLWEWAFDTLQTCLIPYPIINLSTRGSIRCLPRADWTKV